MDRLHEGLALRCGSRPLSGLPRCMPDALFGCRNLTLVQAVLFLPRGAIHRARLPTCCPRGDVHELLPRAAAAGPFASSTAASENHGLLAAYFSRRPDQAAQAVDAHTYPKVHGQPPIEVERFVPRAARKIIHQPVVDGVADQDADERAPETAGPTKRRLLLGGGIHAVRGEACQFTNNDAEWSGTRRDRVSVSRVLETSVGLTFLSLQPPFRARSQEPLARGKVLQTLPFGRRQPPSPLFSPGFRWPDLNKRCCRGRSPCRPTPSSTDCPVRICGKDRTSALLDGHNS